MELLHLQLRGISICWRVSGAGSQSSAVRLGQTRTGQHRAAFMQAGLCLTLLMSWLAASHHMHAGKDIPSSLRANTYVMMAQVNVQPIFCLHVEHTALPGQNSLIA